MKKTKLKEDNLLKKKKKRRLKRNIKNFLLLVLIVVISTYIGWYFQRRENFQNKEVSINYEVVDTKKETTINMAMVGDALIHGIVYQTANKYASYNGYDFTPMLKHTKEIINGYDLAYYNQETILGGTELGLSTYPLFNSPYEVGDAFITAGFNPLTLKLSIGIFSKFSFDKLFSPSFIFLSLTFYTYLLYYTLT